MTTFFLDELKNGAGPGNHGADYAVFRPAYAPLQLSKDASSGEYKIATRDWIKRGRPVSIEIDVPPVLGDPALVDRLLGDLPTEVSR